LNDCVALVYIGKSESQGIALLEAWAMNVPTFVYKANNPISITSEHGTLILGPDQYSAAPYLTDERGLFWSNVSELGSYLKDINHFSPRNKSGMFSAKNCAIEYKNLFND
jgi:glycosyltransferase involved in cell wall biosynthesis